MNAIPSGWGFTDAQALQRHVRPGSLPPAPKPVRRPVVTKGPYVRRAKLEAYAATLHRAPTHAEVWAHFGCSRTAAYNYLHKVIAMLERRAPGKVGAPGPEPITPSEADA